MIVLVVMDMFVIVIMIVATTTISPMRMVVRMIMFVVVIVFMVMSVSTMAMMRMVVMRMVVMRMVVAMAVIMIMSMRVPVVMTVIMAAIMVVSALFGLECPLNLRDRTALSAHHFGQHVVILDIDRVSRDFGWRMTIADVPAHAHQAQRVLGPDFQKLLGCRLDGDQPPIFQLHRIAVIQHAGLVQVEQQIKPAVTFERNPALVAALVIKRDGINNLVCLDEGFTNDRRGAQHGASSKQKISLRHR
jgi:hypothetical protein